MNERDQLRTELERFKVWQGEVDLRRAKRGLMIREKIQQRASMDDWMSNQMKNVTAVADRNVLKLTERDRMFLADCGIEAEQC